MELITHDYLMRAEFWLLITTLLYFVMNGAGIFETAVLIPRWTANPPQSFHLLKEVNLKTFWIVMHSIHELSFILAIIFCWNLEEIRICLLLLFAFHFAVRVWTLAYFAQEIMAFQKMATANQYAMDAAMRAQRWRNWNYIRTGLFIILSLALIPLCLQVFHWNG